MSTILAETPAVDIASVDRGMVIAQRYRIERVIGRGGFAVVYEATHLGTGRPIAIKVLDRVDISLVEIKRFFQEARVTSGLQHPNTIRVFDFGQDDSGIFYLAMELLSGQTLRAVLKERLARGEALSEAEAVQIADGVLRSLSEAHAAGLVHRDLKPSNIFLHSLPGGEQLVKVLDFGIVKSANNNLTMGAPMLMGTPAYMSPEQANAQAVDARSDLYALAVLMFECTSGVLPVDGSNPVEILFKVAQGQRRDLASVARTPLSPRFLSVVNRALSLDPGQRFADAQSMRSALAAGEGAAMWSMSSPAIVPQHPVTSPVAIPPGIEHEAALHTLSSPLFTGSSVAPRRPMPWLLIFSAFMALMSAGTLAYVLTSQELGSFGQAPGTLPIPPAEQQVAPLPTPAKAAAVEERAPIETTPRAAPAKKASKKARRAQPKRDVAHEADPFGP
jgi:serine/threonine protein kinase